MMIHPSSPLIMSEVTEGTDTGGTFTITQTPNSGKTVEVTVTYADVSATEGVLVKITKLPPQDLMKLPRLGHLSSIQPMNPRQ